MQNDVYLFPFSSHRVLVLLKLQISALFHVSLQQQLQCCGCRWAALSFNVAAICQTPLGAQLQGGCCQHACVCTCSLTRFSPGPAQCFLEMLLKKP